MYHSLIISLLLQCQNKLGLGYIGRGRGVRYGLNLFFYPLGGRGVLYDTITPTAPPAEITRKTCSYIYYILFLVASIATVFFRFVVFNIKELLNTVNIMLCHNHTAWSIQSFK